MISTDDENRYGPKIPRGDAAKGEGLGSIGPNSEPVNLFWA